MSLEEDNLTQCQNTPNSFHLAFLLMIDRRHLLMFVTENRQKNNIITNKLRTTASLKSKADAVFG